MEPEALRFLAGKVKLGYYARDSEIVGPASGTVARLYILKQGAVRGRPDNVARSATGVDIVLGAGECFPLGALIGRRATAYSYRAQEDAFVYELEEADFRTLLERSPKCGDVRRRRWCLWPRGSGCLLPGRQGRCQGHEESEKEGDGSE